MGVCSVIYSNLLRYFQNIENTAGLEEVYRILFGNIGGSNIEDRNIVANDPELRIPFDFNDIFFNIILILF